MTAVPGIVWVSVPWKGLGAGEGVRASAPPGATLPGCAWRKPSGIPSAAVAQNRGASVSSGFPSRQRLGGLHDATARSVTFVQAPPAKSARTRFPGPAVSVPHRARGFWTLPAPLRGGTNRKAWHPCLVGRQARASRQGEGAATLAGEPGRCSQRRGEADDPLHLEEQWVPRGSPRPDGWQTTHTIS